MTPERQRVADEMTRTEIYEELASYPEPDGHDAFPQLLARLGDLGRLEDRELEELLNESRRKRVERQRMQTALERDEGSMSGCLIRSAVWWVVTGIAIKLLVWIVRAIFFDG